MKNPDLYIKYNDKYQEKSWMQSKESRPVIFFLFIFFFTPIISIFLLFIYLSISKINNYKIILLFSILLPIYISSINAISIPRSDMLWYLEDYYEAKGQSLIEYILNFGRNGAGKELLFPIINYILYQIIGNSQIGYMFCISFLSYGTIGYSIYRLGRALKLPEVVTLTGIILLIFFPLILTFSMVLLRQFVAGALLIYILIERAFYKKKCWILMGLLPLLHMSAFFFLPIMLLPFIKNPISKKSIVLILFFTVGLAFYQIIASIFFMMLSNISPVIAYVLERASADTTYDLGKVDSLKVLILIFITVVPPIVYYSTYSRSNKEFRSMVSIIHISFILCFFILMNLHQSELANRFSLYAILLFPIIIIYLINYIKQHTFISSSISLGTFLIFCFYIIKPDIGYHHFAEDIYTTSMFHFFFKFIL